MAELVAVPVVWGPGVETESGLSSEVQRELEPVALSRPESVTEFGLDSVTLFWSKSLLLCCCGHYLYCMFTVILLSSMVSTLPPVLAETDKVRSQCLSVKPRPLSHAVAGFTIS